MLFFLEENKYLRNLNDVRADWDTMPINFEKTANSRVLRSAMLLHHCRNKSTCPMFHVI